MLCPCSVSARFMMRRVRIRRGDLEEGTYVCLILGSVDINERIKIPFRRVRVTCCFEVIARCHVVAQHRQGSR